MVAIFRVRLSSRRRVSWSNLREYAKQPWKTKRKLIKVQRAWLVYRDAEAELEADNVRGGTAYPMEYNGARTKLTNDRVTIPGRSQ
jgi:uncharacterized protein YecT (DUF1311 family)